MSTGISISSINRIKELAEEKRYAEALKILDTQNLEKSINPQFLRISGEIFRENKRYYDSRKILLKSHQMSPQGIRIIYELIQLYLELGYFTKARTYYEQYLFYSTPEDTQKDYVEYIMKKATGADVKELASILIPILEQMPEDQWNFEAVLLYDKMGRKDKALEECQYILENFKASIYVDPVIQYIDDKLDVDQYFYIYPKEEAEEDEELFGDLIAKEEELLQKDHLRMYPPEARIVIEAEDKEAIETRPAREKKAKKPRKRKTKNKERDADENVTGEQNAVEASGDGKADSDTDTVAEGSFQAAGSENGIPTSEDNESVNNTEENKSDDEQERIQNEENIRQAREAALDKLLSKKINTEQIRESAKQMAKTVKEIDTEKAKNQVKSVAESVKDNVKKATDMIGEAVGAKTAYEEIENEKPVQDDTPAEEFVDGIIESILEPPKKAVGSVVVNEELDALIPDSLEAMSAQEIADIEAKKEENERLELEALEASLRLEEARKAKRKQKEVIENTDSELQEESDADREAEHIYSDSDGDFARLKAQFLAEMNEEEEKPLDSLGFISVVQSDVDRSIEDAIPDTAEILHQMIVNKEFYTGEDSTRFESRASYENHGFEVEDYDFEAYLDEEMDRLSDESTEPDLDVERMTSVKRIYAQEEIVDFSEIIPEQSGVSTYEADKRHYNEEIVSDAPMPQQSAETNQGEVLTPEIRQTGEDTHTAGVQPEQKDTRTVEAETGQTNAWEEKGSLENETVSDAKVSHDFVSEKRSEDEERVYKTERYAGQDDSKEDIQESIKKEQISTKTEEVPVTKRELLRVRILLSEDMLGKLTSLKESR